MILVNKSTIKVIGDAFNDTYGVLIDTHEALVKLMF